MTKPPYRVPSMAEIAAGPPNGFTVASTFSGCGGSCLGFKMAGFRAVFASEFIPAARDTYRANFPGVHVDERDIRAVQPQDLLEAAGLRQGELDVLEGSPPCAAFSTAGKLSDGWGKVRKYSETEQRVDDLFYEYARLVRGVRPRAFVAENVAGLVKGVAKGYFKEILRELRAAGYRVEAQVLDAQWLGVPQARRRLIFVGVREDLGRDPAFPRPLPYRYSVREALGLPPGTRVVHDTSGQYSAGDVTDAPCPTISIGVRSLNSRHYQVVTPVAEPTPEELRELSIDGYAIGKEWSKTGTGKASEKFFNLVKPDLDKPCPTVTQTGKIRGAASVVHPTQRRKFSPAELRRIGSFPDDFALTGSYEQQWERIGRAVPPVMMRAIAEVVRDRVLR